MNEMYVTGWMLLWVLQKFVFMVFQIVLEEIRVMVNVIGIHFRFS
jgi:hypothetical protein